MEFYVLIFRGVFVLLAGSALFCSFFIAYFSIIKRRKELQIFAIYFFSSALVSLTNSILPSYAHTSIPIMLFYTLDFVFCLYHIAKISYYSKQKKTISFLCILSPLFCFLVIFFVGSGVIEENYVILTFNILLLIFTSPFFFSILKEEKTTIDITQYEFWFCASFFFFNIATISGNIIFLPDGGSSYGLFSAIIYGITYVSWIIKYFMLLKSALCKIKTYT